jgi:hypothetical protein
METDVVMKIPQTMQEYQRYMRLHAIVEELNSGTVTKTNDWYAEHNHLLNMYDSYFPSGFTGINPIIQDKKFRENCVRLDALINKLMKEYTLYHWFSAYDYLQFNKILIEVIDITHDFLGEFDQDDEMVSMFEGMTV